MSSKLSAGQGIGTVVNPFPRVCLVICQSCFCFFFQNRLGQQEQVSNGSFAMAVATMLLLGLLSQLGSSSSTQEVAASRFSRFVEGLSSCDPRGSNMKPRHISCVLEQVRSRWIARLHSQELLTQVAPFVMTELVIASWRSEVHEILADVSDGLRRLQRRVTPANARLRHVARSRRAARTLLATKGARFEHSRHKSHTG